METTLAVWSTQVCKCVHVHWVPLGLHVHVLQNGGWGLHGDHGNLISEGQV